MFKKITVLVTILYLSIHSQAFGCSGSAIESAGSSMAAEVSITPARKGSSIGDRIDRILTALTLKGIGFLTLPPVLNETAGTFLDPSNAANIAVVVGLQIDRTQGATATAIQFRELEIEEKKENAQPPKP